MAMTAVKSGKIVDRCPVAGEELRRIAALAVVEFVDTEDFGGFDPAGQEAAAPVAQRQPLDQVAPWARAAARAADPGGKPVLLAVRDQAQTGVVGPEMVRDLADRLGRAVAAGQGEVEQIVGAVVVLCHHAGHGPGRIDQLADPAASSAPAVGSGSPHPSERSPAQNPGDDEEQALGRIVLAHVVSSRAARCWRFSAKPATAMRGSSLGSVLGTVPLHLGRRGRPDGPDRCVPA